MRVRALALSAVLVACTPAATFETRFRDTTVPMATMAGFDPAQFSGQWHRVGWFAEQGMSPCRAVPFTVSPRGDGTLTVYSQDCDRSQKTGVAQVSGPGRMDVRFDDATSDPFWVLWVDESYRTAVIGTPSGHFGYILNKGQNIPGDRLEAARKVLAWNGYSLSSLQLAVK